MASRTTLNAKNLEALGSERLAALLIEISTGSAASKRRLRIELAGLQSSEEVAREVVKRLTTIDRSKSKIGWRRIKALKADLDTQRKVITDIIAADDPVEALQVMWRFMELANSVLARGPDTNDTILSIFRLACADLGAIAMRASLDRLVLAETAFRALLNNEFGQYDDLVSVLGPALEKPALEHLKSLLLQELSSLNEKSEDGKEHRRLSYTDMLEARKIENRIRASLRRIADAQGDVDAFIEMHRDQQDDPGAAIDSATRLLNAGRTAEALQLLLKVATEDRKLFEWEAAFIAALEALGRTDEAQTLRWMSFERTLNVSHLRAYLKRMPDFDDMEAEEHALSHAAAYPDAHQALGFFLDWPHLRNAAELVLTRLAELDGSDHELLTRAAENLSDRHPLAAVILLRSMIDFVLEKKRSVRYRHALRQLAELERISAGIEDFGSVEPHESYLAAFNSRHRNKPRFWKLAGAAAMRRPA